MKTDSMQWWWAAVVVGAIVLGCGGGAGTGPAGPVGAGGGTAGHGDTGGSGGSSSGTGGGTTTQPSWPACSTPDDCPNWYCDCRTGPPVNSRRCINNRCVDAANSCGSACAGFGTCWLGTAGGGFSGGSNFGPSTCGSSGTGGGGGSSASCSQTDLGKACTAPSQCQSGLCFGASPSFVCTKGCTTANDCPRNWQCQSVASGGAVCMSGTSVTPWSSSSVCSAVSVNDVGAPCNASCQGGFCVANMCSKRCDVSSDCPGSWTCGSVGGFNGCKP